DRPDRAGDAWFPVAEGRHVGNAFGFRFFDLGAPGVGVDLDRDDPVDAFLQHRLPLLLDFVDIAAAVDDVDGPAALGDFFLDSLADPAGVLVALEDRDVGDVFLSDRSRIDSGRREFCGAVFVFGRGRAGAGAAPTPTAGGEDRRAGGG